MRVLSSKNEIRPKPNPASRSLSVMGRTRVGSENIDQYR